MFLRYTDMGVGHPVALRRIVRDCLSLQSAAPVEAMDVDEDGSDGEDHEQEEQQWMDVVGADEESEDEIEDEEDEEESEDECDDLGVEVEEESDNEFSF
jgi:hypothetical protein